MSFFRFGKVKDWFNRKAGAEIVYMIRFRDGWREWMVAVFMSFVADHNLLSKSKKGCLKMKEYQHFVIPHLMRDPSSVSCRTAIDPGSRPG